MRSLATCLLLAATFSIGRAEELRWKFTAGETWQVTHEGVTDSTTLVNGKSNKTAVRTTVTVKWTIDKVTDGAANVTQEITRLQLEVDSPAAGAVKYDSDSQAAPTTPTEKDLAAMMKPLVGGKLTCTITPAGEVQSVVPDATLAKRLDLPLEDGAKINATQQGILQLLQQPLAAFPATAKAGESWIKERTLDLPFGAGSLKQTHTFEGVQDKDSAKLARINVLGELTVKKDPAAKIALKSHEQSGVLWFDAEAGRLVESETSQKISTVTPYRDGEISVKSASKIRVTFKKL